VIGTLRVRPPARRDRVLRGARWAASTLWAVLFWRECYVEGVPFDREGLMFWIATGIAAVSIGRRALWTVAADWLPFALVLIGYDYLRGLSDTAGLPTWWHPQLDVDRFLFAGHVPTLWLQERLKYPDVRWWDVLVCLCYLSFFLLPYVTAGVFWLRSRSEFYRWSGRFAGLSLLGFGIFTLIPTAPPWAAARCPAGQVAGHPNNPACMYASGQYPPGGGLLGEMSTHRPGANPWIERISLRGFSDLRLGAARVLVDKGQSAVDLVAAVPSLHLGGTTLFVLFLWRRVNRWWRPLLVAYPLLMTFSLTYSGEHYVSDCIAGALCAVLVHAIANRVERRRMRTRAADTLDREQPPVPGLENTCPPIETMPSST
jgi:hypothetical protein